MTELKRRPRIWPVLLASAIGIAILVTLGIWQVERLKWKEGLLAQLAANAAAEPVGLASVEALQAQGRDVEYIKVKFTGTYKHVAWKKMISTFGGGQGWLILTPAISADGRAVIVNRGSIPDQMLASFDKPDGERQITGVVRTYTRGKGYFDPENDPQGNLWYWWDISAMLASSGLDGTPKPVPFVVQVLPGTVAAEFPKPDEPKANLSNNHLGYAITWFGLALTLAGVAFFYVRGLRKKQPA